MHSLVIAEKPSAAAKIAEALADKKPVKKVENKVPYYELTHKGKKIFIGSAVGHLFGLTEEKKSGLKYPVFDIVWKPAYQTSKTAGYTKDYIELLKKLSSDADSFYNGCDVDIEGELIFRNALRFICGKEDANRMYFSTLTKDELIDAFEHAKPHIDFGLAEAGEARHFMDHYWGISVSRALMSAIKAAGTFKIMSSGRVQGPALKILAEREKEIIIFKPVPYWQVFLHTKLKNKNVIAVHKEERFWEEQKADQVIQNTKKKDRAFVESIERKEFSQEPPHPFDLTAMQLEAYRTLRIAPKETLAITQELYIAGYISYPRTSSNQLPPALNYKKIITSISKQEEYTEICAGLLKKKNLSPNNGKKTDPAHPACYPTGEVPKNLKGRSFLLYDLIVRRTLASFGEAAIRESATVVIDVNNEDFILKGTITKFPGWHEIYGRYVMLKEEEIPNVKEKEKIKVDDIVKESKETQPPKRYTPASIIKELERRNLGTKSTRAAIVDSLYQRNYVRDDSLEVTDLGIKTIETLEKYSPYILNEKLTRHFEKEMNEIQEGKKNKEEVLKEAEKVLTKVLKQFKENEEKIGKELAAANIETRNKDSIVGKCLKCSKDLRVLFSRRFKSYFVACSGYPDCKTTYSLPQGLPKPSDKKCKECDFIMVTIIRKGRRPYDYCINKECPAKVKWREEQAKKKVLNEK
ncbi:DNA topoisomerase I [Candidatus Woesearchaeota archaeon]|nr:DNA topoisomerase I [Candidatus Woesearchaeota archaeon]